MSRILDRIAPKPDTRGQAPEARLRDGTRPRSNATVGEVRTGCIGRGYAGKTALFRAMIEGPFGEYFPSGLHVDLGDPREVAQMIREAEETRRILEMSGLPATLETSQIRYYLYDGDQQRVVYKMREVIGQILTHTMPSSAQEQQACYEEYLRSLLDTHVLWAVLPCPPPEPSKRDRRRYANDLRITSAYLREALRLRSSNQPCAVALVLSKIDALFPSAEQAHSALEDGLLIEALGPLVNTVKRSERVTDSAIIPVTAFGFGNAIQRKEPKGNPGTPERGMEDPFGDEPTWLLKEGAVQQPYNLTTLVQWTLLFGLLNQEVNSGDQAPAEPEIAELCRMLGQDLDAGDHWLVPIKGRLVTNG